MRRKSVLCNNMSLTMSMLVESDRAELIASHPACELKFVDIGTFRITMSTCHLNSVKTIEIHLKIERKALQSTSREYLC